VNLPDVNVLVGAFRRDAPQHAELSAWLEGATNGPETLGLTDPVLGGVVRVLTHRRVFAEPSSLDEVLGAIDRLRSADGVARIVPGPRHWEIFAELCRAADARGNLVADAQHAAVAIEHGATWVTLDRDFARFDGLRWRSPLDGR
jgi:hypothetical protein